MTPLFQITWPGPRRPIPFLVTSDLSLTSHRLQFLALLYTVYHVIPECLVIYGQHRKPHLHTFQVTCKPKGHFVTATILAHVYSMLWSIHVMMEILHVMLPVSYSHRKPLHICTSVSYIQTCKYAYIYVHICINMPTYMHMQLCIILFIHILINYTYIDIFIKYMYKII